MIDDQIELVAEDIRRDMRILKALMAVQGLSFLLNLYAVFELYNYFN